MTGSQAVAVDAWVIAERGCHITCDVVGDQAQFEFGNTSGSLHLLLDESTLVTLAEVATEARTKLQAIPIGEEVNFTIQGATR